MARLDDVEREAVEAAVGPWSRDVDRLRKSVLALWSARGGVLTGAELRALLAQLDLPAPVDLGPAIVEAAELGDEAVEGKTAVHSSTVAATVAAGDRTAGGEGAGGGGASVAGGAGGEPRRRADRPGAADRERGDDAG